MGTTAPRHARLEDYLSNPAYAHCEYVDGDIVELHLGTNSHSTVQANCIRLLFDWKRKNGRGSVRPELHCRLNVGGQLRYRLPDVALILRPISADYLEGAPELAVEIRSPEDTLPSMFRKMGDYFANGAQLGWIVDPFDRCVYIIAPDRPASVLLADDTLTGGGLLSGLEFLVSEFFVE